MEGSGGKKEEERRGGKGRRGGGMVKKEEGRRQTLTGGLPGTGFPTVCMEGTVAGYIKTGDACTLAYLEI